MITHSPESPMPEPYKTYVRQRADAIAATLKPVVRDTDVQLCPQAITPDQEVVDRRQGDIVYGCVVDDERDGLKTTLYNGNEFAAGIAAFSLDEALRYADQLFRQGERVRIKEPRHSDGDGQLVASSLEEVAAIVDAYPELAHTGLVLMPDLDTILNRYTAGSIDLGQHGSYAYYGHEYVTPHPRDGRQVFAGGDIVVGNRYFQDQLEDRAGKSGIPPYVRDLAKRALAYYGRRVNHMGRASMDVIDGITHGGKRLVTVVDPTPRVGGHTPAETLAIAAMKQESRPIAHASGRLYFDPEATPATGTNFVDTPSLVINAQVTEVG